MLFPSEQSALPASLEIFSGGHVVEGSSHTPVGAIVDDKLAKYFSSEGSGVVPINIMQKHRNKVT